MTSPLVLRLAALITLCSGAIASHAFAAGSADATSVFVRAQTANGIHWLPWGDAAFQRAKAENKPIYLHIGAFTSELSRAMARQSFSNPDTVKFFNDNFVCVVVDRDEQPQLAALYRAYVHTVKQLEGWPVNVWLTPDLKPFEGATYLPPSEEWGKPGLMNVAKQVASAWQTDPAAQRQKAADAATTLSAAEKLPAPAAVDVAATTKLLGENAEAWKAKFDATNGGFGDPPKHLEPELLRYLLADPSTREMAVTTLRAMADGAIRDPLDGGFFHQAGDAAWRQPYFQKQASDQARMALAYLDAAKVDSDPRFPTAARGALTYVLEQLGDPAHGFAAAQDAGGESAAYYLWTLDDFRAALGANEGDAFAKTLGVAENGNIPDDAYTGLTVAKKNILYRAVPVVASADAAEAKLCAKLLQVRAKRPAPQRDSLAPTGVHGLLLAAFARAGAELKDARLQTAAKQIAALLQTQGIAADGALRRMFGQSTAAAPDDYAYVIDGLRTYATTAHDASADKLAAALETRLASDYFDATAGRYWAAGATTTPTLWARVHVPSPAAGDPASPESAMTLTLSAQSPQPAAAASLANALAAEAKDSPEAARGDLLFALRTHAEKLKR